jgi:hypothetical protein
VGLLGRRKSGGPFVSAGLQERIHALEMGAGAKFVKGLVASLAFVVLALTWNSTQYRHFANPEAMDAAQLAANIAEGRGFTTHYIRPFSAYVLREHTGSMFLDGDHPDISNAPVYPHLLAGMMTRLSSHSQIGDPQSFTAYAPEVWIGRLNQLLFFLVLVVLFLLARRLFDTTVAWIAVITLGGAELFWRFSLSGLPTLLLALNCLLLFWCLAAAERGAREGKWGLFRLAPLALLGGALTGVAGLTLYSFAWLALPVALFFAFAFTQHRLVLTLAAVVGCAAVMTPWLARNYSLSGHLFGTAGFAPHMDSERFPGDRLERALRPEQADTPMDIRKAGMGEHWRKFLRNGARVVREDLPKLGGSWMGALFLAGLLMPFNNPGLRRLRWFTAGALALLCVVQALGRTHLSDLTPENLPAALAPLVFLFGAAMLAVLVDQLQIDFPPTRNLLLGFLCAVLCLPLVFALLSPRRTAMAYPPYHPPAIQEAAGWMRATELTMSDMPWALAWYGNRDCVWLTWDLAEDASAIDRAKRIQALHLTQLTLDRELVSKQLRDEEPWGAFAVDVLVREEIPEGFPLKHAFADWFPDQLFLTDRPRWGRSAGSKPNP